MSAPCESREPIEAAIARLKSQGSQTPILKRPSGPIRSSKQPAKPPTLPRQSR